MPFKPKQSYSPVPNNEYDLRIPLHTEESFQHGIVFPAKYIGSLDVPRPNNRMEIVAAMRRIRYEFKAKGMKKKKVTIEVSVEGVKVAIVKRKTKKKDWPTDDASLLLMQHPVYRIFYVSHDSQDLKIFSYIARDASSNLFRCNVFKTAKKSQAMKIVRTVGQAFEVCHKLAGSAQSAPSVSSHATQEDDEVDNEEEDESLDEEEEPQEVPEVAPVPDAAKKSTEPSDPEQQPVDVLSVEVPARVLDAAPCGTLERPRVEPAAQQQFQQQLHMLQQQQQRVPESHNCGVASGPTSTGSGSTPLARQHEVLLLRQQLEQQQQQTQAAFAQVKLLKDQLAAETAARMEAQARTHQLLIHNKELLDHIQTLVVQMQELESKVPVVSAVPPPSSIPQSLAQARLPVLRDADCQQELVNMAAAMLTAAAASTQNSREMQAQQLQQQLQQQQQQYAILLAQAVQQQQQQQAAFLPLLANSPLSPSGINQAAYFQFQPQPMNNATPLYQAAQNQGFSPMNAPNTPSAAPSGPFILPLAEGDQSGSHDSGLGSGHLNSGAHRRSMDVIRRLQLIGEDSSNGGASVTSLHSSDSDRQRMDSSLESMSGSGRPSLPTLHQQLESLRLGGDASSSEDVECRTPSGGTLRRNGPFITRSTSEKVPHRNEILAQVQRTAWARHTTK